MDKEKELERQRKVKEEEIQRQEKAAEKQPEMEESERWQKFELEKLKVESEMKEKEIEAKQKEAETKQTPQTKYLATEIGIRIARSRTSVKTMVNTRKLAPDKYTVRTLDNN